MIEGIFDDSIFNDAAFETGDAEAFVSDQGGIEQAFAQDHGPIRLLPHEIEERRRFWVKFLKDWKRARDEKRERDELELLALFALMPMGASA